jgi:hypothetical protein
MAGIHERRKRVMLAVRIRKYHAIAAPCQVIAARFPR